MLRRRIGRPGLIGTMARTAVIAGTASAVTGGMARRQAGRAEEQQAAAAAQEQAMADRVAAQVQAQTPAPAPAPPPAQTPAPAPAPAQTTPGTSAEDRMRLLRELGQMKTDGLLTEEEFAAEKARILAS